LELTRNREKRRDKGNGQGRGIRKRDKTYQRHAQDKSSEDEVKGEESLASFPAKCQGCLSR
jgi:hypothetical protein